MSSNTPICYCESMVVNLVFKGTSSLAVMRCHEFGTKLTHYGIKLAN